MKIPLSELGLDCEKKELKDCPFCGSMVSFIGEARAFDNIFVGKIGQIICPNCFSRAHGDMRKKEECVKAWNTRTAENEKSVLVIEEDILARAIFLWAQNRKSIEYTDVYSTNNSISLSEHLSQNAKSFMRIEKE